MKKVLRELSGNSRLLLRGPKNLTLKNSFLSPEKSVLLRRKKLLIPSFGFSVSSCYLCLLVCAGAGWRVGGSWFGLALQATPPTHLQPFLLSLQQFTRPAHSLTHYQIVGFLWYIFVDSFRPLYNSEPGFGSDQMDPGNHLFLLSNIIDLPDLVHYNKLTCIKQTFFKFYFIF